MSRNDRHRENFVINRLHLQMDQREARTVKTSKIKGVFLALLCVCFLLSGCGEAASSDTVPQPSDTTSQPQESPEGEEPSSDAATQSGSETSVDVNVEPPLSGQDLQMPAPDFLPEDLQLLYRRACKMMIIRIGTYAIDVTDYFPCDTPDTSLTYWDQLTIDGKSYAPALNHYQSWELFYSTLDSIFTKDFMENSYLASGNTVYFRPVEGRLYYLPTERGFAPGYEQDTTKMDFVLLQETPDRIDIQVTVTYAVGETANPAFRQAWLDGLVSNTETYTISLQREERGWRFSQFDVPF